MSKLRSDKKVIDKIWYKNLSKSEVIGHCGADGKKTNDHAESTKVERKKTNIFTGQTLTCTVMFCLQNSRVARVLDSCCKESLIEMAHTDYPALEMRPHQVGSKLSTKYINLINFLSV